MKSSKMVVSVSCTDKQLEQIKTGRKKGVLCIKMYGAPLYCANATKQGGIQLSKCTLKTKEKKFDYAKRTKEGQYDNRRGQKEKHLCIKKYIISYIDSRNLQIQ